MRMVMTCFSPSSIHWKKCNQYLGLRVQSEPHLDGLSNQPQWELLFKGAKTLALHHHPLCTFCPQLQEQRESVGKTILNGPGIPLCSSCYPLKSQTMGLVWTKGRHVWVAQIFLLSECFLFSIELPEEKFNLLTSPKAI